MREINLLEDKNVKRKGRFFSNCLEDIFKIVPPFLIFSTGVFTGIAAYTYKEDNEKSVGYSLGAIGSVLLLGLLKNIQDSYMSYKNKRVSRQEFEESDRLISKFEAEQKANTKYK